METIRKISSEEINNLYVFTRKHFVEHYDLQTELVDHLANAIELRWKANPLISFDDALAAEFKKFGIFGFSDIVEQRTNALNKRYAKLIWRCFRSYFTLPKVMLTIALILAVRLLLGFNVYVAFGFYLIVQFGYWYKMLKNLKVLKKRQEETGRKWILEELIFRGVALTGMAGLWLNFMQTVFEKTYTVNIGNEYTLWIMAFLFVLITLYNHIAVYIIPSKAEQYLKETYPEYGIV